VVVIRETTDDDLEAVVALLRAADDTRIISVEGLRHMRRTRPERARVVELVADEDGTVVGGGTAGLNTWTTTEGAAWAYVTVGSRFRRQGVGAELGATLIEHLTGLDAKKVTCMFRGNEENERWATAQGWSKLLTGPLIALDPRDVPEPSVPAGYRCVALVELGPEDLFEAVAAAALDEPSPVPNDNFDLDEFVREWNEPDLDRASSTAVLDDAGQVVAFSFLMVGGDRASHGFTGTVAEHRGRGLATAAKKRVLRKAAARGVTRVTTSNAEENAAMRAINRKLGFEPIGEHVIYGRDL
jgi:RimJ/RimL family protein N-acetyltransferase/N-acetylglutamate synthase-like GNAT family acetyltransferase